MSNWIALLIGAACGIAVGCAKYALIWKRPLKDGVILENTGVYLRMIINSLLDVAAIALIFFMRRALPFGLAALWSWVLIGTALALSLAGILLPLKTVYGNKNGEETP